MSPRLSTAPTVREAASIAVRSGRRAASIGVGTVTMKKSASRSAAASLVKVKPGPLQIGAIDLARAVLAGPQLGDAVGIDVEAGDRGSLRAQKLRRPASPHNQGQSPQSSGHET